MQKVKITKIKSSIDTTERQKRTMVALKLNKMNQSVELPLNDALKGMIKKIQHLVKVEDIA